MLFIYIIIIISHAQAMFICKVNAIKGCHCEVVSVRRVQFGYWRRVKDLFIPLWIDDYLSCL
jgi:hypothetical protein